MSTIVGQTQIVFEKFKHFVLSNKGMRVTLWPCHLHGKKYLKAKEEGLWKLKYFTMQKTKKIFKKLLSKKPKSFKIL
jgi:hypothetical protein